MRKFIYSPGIDEPICIIDVADSNAVYYYHFDGLGSVAALSDVNNVVVESYSYDVFGAPTIYDTNNGEISKSAIGNPYMFTARRADDETALYYYRARYYAFDIGRFLQIDPIGYVGSLNLYTYCGNNSLIWTDPYGLCKETGGYHWWDALSDIPGEVLEGLNEGVILTSNALTLHLLEGRGIPGWVDSANVRQTAGLAGRVSEYCGYTVTGALSSAALIEMLGLDVVLWGSATGTAGSNIGGDVSVYQSISNGVTNYVGITNDLARRGGEQLRLKGIEIEAIPGLSNLSRADALAVEQVLIEYHGLMKNGGTLINKINAISPNNPIYPQAIERGYELLKQVTNGG